ncbi:MAG TPA: pirin family protein [Burkholderiales bacterium]|nr:pirin family protein [Burkholderiales bacterium]
MSAIAHLVPARVRDLGGFAVRRILPWGGGRMVGPFIFLDHMGPVGFPAGQGIDVRPHPHIGLATVTYLYEGEIVHRDSLGVVQTIRPGDVNWMTAGRGIVHSERTDSALRARGHRVHGLQSWVALPLDKEESEPWFRHYPASRLPALARDGVELRVIAGKAFGLVSPVEVFSGLFYVDLKLRAGAGIDLAPEHAERAAHVAEGEVEIEGERLGAGTIAILEPCETVRVGARGDSRLALLGGAPLEGRRLIWWNFVSSSKARIEQAKRDWAEGKFAPVPGETEFISLPRD